MAITIGNYLSTNYTYTVGSRTVTMYGLPFKTDATTVKKVELIRPNLTTDTTDTLLRAFSILYGDVHQATPDTTLTAGTPSAGGSVNAGTHSYKVTFLINGYETLPSIASNVITTDVTNKTVALTNIPTGQAAVTGRNIYRTNAGGSIYYYIGNVTGNTVTTFTDTTADNTTTLAPTSTTCYDFTWSATLNSIATPTVASGDLFNIEVDVLDTSKAYDLGYDSVAEVSPVKLEYDSVFNLVTTQAFTTSWVTAGSAFSMEGRNIAKCYCLFTVGSLTNARFKIIGRHTAGGTAFPVDVVFDKPSRMIEVEDDISTANPYFKTYELNNTATQYFTFDIITNMAVSEVEILIAGVGTMTSSALTIDVVKAYSPTVSNDAEIRDYEPKVIGSASNVATGTTYYPNTNGEIINGISYLSVQLLTRSGVTTTFQISDNKTTWLDCTPLGIITGDNNGSSRVRTTSITSFLNDTVKIDFNNLNAKYFRVKAVVTGATNSVLYSIKKRSF